jgi:RNA polymerase sigma-70 factor (ECF subfamily)
MLTRTTTALLEALLDPADDEVWHDFDRRYRPILIAFARRLGLPDEDAADAAQDTLARFVRSYRDGKYDRDRGRLRSWIIGIARHCVYDIHQHRATNPKRGLSAISELPDESTLNAMWDEECEQEILRQGISELRQQTKTDEGTIRAFEMLAFDGRKPAEIAEALSMSLNDVYLAKHRCLKRLREIISQLEHLYEVA